MNRQRSKGGPSADRLLVFLVGLLLGVLAGAVAMLLLAPRGGKDTVPNPEARRKAAPSGG